MIIFLVLVYLLILFILVKIKIIPFNLFWKLSPILVFVLLNILLFIPMGWAAPSGPLLVRRHSVPIVPDVAGEVIEVPVEANVPLKANDVLFRIDPVPFQTQVDSLDAQLKFAQLRYEQMAELHSRDTGRLFDVQQREAEVKQLRAQLEAAKWNLDKTVVRAPANGYVTNIALRKGARVASLPLSPAMAFIDTSETLIGVEIKQISARFVEPGQRVEATFKFFPGKIFKGRVESVLQAIASGQTQISGQAIAPPKVFSDPFVVLIKLDDAKSAQRLPAGTAGDAAIFTERLKPTHVIRRVMLRMTAIMNYINPF
ncbi:conserved exported protein of unknown function [Candidatus Filomicrobium marinum]|uniref:Multidrug resistance protein MdtA-like barrel-sandwich hybrid domain-containing protein n=2 Tax=Filomicrobium TaxID=119044 RepID=A0A0D6JEG2_9HYPH|nr:MULTISPECIES: efflux RND transporter periplasmic adaptor subunit [Filomicrobium]MCV0368101.1 efflux RND transporter periplasmic adaptor subunit [Filomicrobium sp.]CFX14714.1 conserved exported protein of unknown function [Candidatus Filomicrobium marinum]CPR17844.1 conserved exported protein of unknown function [Candidatus Filomicrobium marinum]SDO27118.1 Multidrug resistance efflux pump [Filomicrobium insigne]